MQTFRNDLRYALRQLRRSPGFTLTVVLTLALGVGANAIVFSVLNALVLRPLPLPQARQLVSLNRVGGAGAADAPSPSQSYPDYCDLRDANQTFSGIAAYAIKRGGVGVAGAVHASWFYEVSENYFDVLGLQPALGRFFRASDAHGPNSSPYAVLNYAYWQRQLNGDPHVVGRVIEINKHPFTVLGVAPRNFGGTELLFSADFWVPMLNQEQIEGYNYLQQRGDHEIWIIGRLKPSVSVAQAEADLNVIGKTLASRYTQSDDGLSFGLSRPGLLGDLLGRPVRSFLYGVMALAALVLLAACANLGSLFAARAADRARELSVRLALGASRAVLIRQLLTEAVLVSLFGGASGLALADTVLRALSVWRPSPDFPIGFTVAADAHVSALALALAVASGIFFGLVPVRQIWRSNTCLVMKSGAPAAGSRRWTLRDGLLVLQIVLCSVLVTASLVAVRGLVRSLHTDYGFRPDGAVLASFDLQMSGHNAQQSLAFQHRALDAISSLPGVTAVGSASKTPISLSSSDTDVWRQGVTDFRDATAAANPNYFDVSPGYFGAARTQLLAGRDFTWHDDDHSPRVAIVNQTFARKVFGTTDAVGRYFSRGGPNVKVIGVVEDGKYNTLTEDPTAAMFVPSAQEPNTDTVLVVRSRAGVAATAAGVHAVLRQLDPSLPATITPWPQALGIMLFPSVAATVALGIMGALTAMLAVTGIFGMASYAVSKRMRELGLRVALGASRRQVLAAALGRPARLLLFGSLAGLALGALASRLLAHVVYQATSQDPVVLLGVVASMALLALAATWLPARRALHVDPALLLREE